MIPIPCSLFPVPPNRQSENLAWGVAGDDLLEDGRGLFVEAGADIGILASVGGDLLLQHFGVGLRFGLDDFAFGLGRGELRLG